MSRYKLELFLDKSSIPLYLCYQIIYYEVIKSVLPSFFGLVEVLRSVLVSRQPF